MEHILIAWWQLMYSKLLSFKNTSKRFLSSWSFILINLGSLCPGFVAVVLLLLLLFSPYICISMLLAFQISLLECFTCHLKLPACFCSSLPCSSKYSVKYFYLRVSYSLFLILQIYRLFKAIFLLLDNKKLLDLLK